VKTIICVYDSKETDFSKNGLRVLNNCISCIITEELNGSYELTLTHPIDEQGKWKYLVEDNIIKADGQLFRIYNKDKMLTEITVNCRHIFYDLLDNFLEDARPTDLSAVGALDWILTHAQYTHPFIAEGDAGGSNTKYYVQKNVVESIFDIITTWGGCELKRDNFTIGLYNNIGADRGIQVLYGKNIQGIDETLNTDGLCTRGLFLGKGGLMLTEKYVDSPFVGSFSHPKVRVIENKDIDNEDDLRTYSSTYFANTKCDIPLANYKISFLELSKTLEYQQNYAILERVYLGDTVTVRHSKLNIDLKTKVIKTTKNVLTGRLEKIELGNFKKNILSEAKTNIQEVKTDVINAKSDLQEAMDSATDLINTALGGNVLKRQGELLIMDTIDPMTATYVWKWNINGLGFSSTGINGDFTTAITADGHIVADFITVGILNAMVIKTGLLKSANSTSWINMDDGTFNFGNGRLTFNGTTFELDYSGTELADNLDSVNNNLDTINNFIRFTNGNIILGEVGNAITLKIQNDRISFITGQDDLGNDIEVAYFSNSKLFILDAEIVGSIKIGTFAFVPASNGNLNFKKVV
jgi:phage minor structural protein